MAIRGWIRGLVAVAGLASCFACILPVTIKMWMHEHPPRIPLDKAFIAAFEKDNPDIKIDYQVIGASEYATKLITAFAGGSGPDLFNQTVTLVSQYYNAKIIAPIDYAAMGYADEKALTSQYLSGFDGARFNGKLYGIPTEVSNYACFTNNAEWQAAGLDPQKDFPTTWEDMVAVAEKLTKRDANGNPIRRGFDFDWPSGPAYWLTVSTMLHQLGSTLIDEQAYKATYDTPEAAKVMQYLVDWVNKYKLGGTQYTDSRTAFLGGDIATDCSMGIWGVPQVKDAKIGFSVFPLPRWKGGVDEGFDAYAYYMMVNARSAPEVQKAAWKFAKFYTDHAVELFKGAGLFVPRPDVMQSTTDHDSQVFLTELKKAKFAPRIVGYSQVVDTMLRARDKMMQGGEPIASVLPTTNNEINAVLKREKARAEAMFK
jgi:multiple sugar transport system substrate-binding protein